MNRRSRSHRLPECLAGSTHDVCQPYYATTSTASEVFTAEYRSTRARAYTKTVTSRNGLVVHNERARGYDSNVPSRDCNVNSGVEYFYNRSHRGRPKATTLDQRSTSRIISTTPDIPNHLCEDRRARKAIEGGNGPSIQQTCNPQPQASSNDFVKSREIVPSHEQPDKIGQESLSRLGVSLQPGLNSQVLDSHRIPQPDVFTDESSSASTPSYLRQGVPDDPRSNISSSNPGSSSGLESQNSSQASTIGITDNGFQIQRCFQRKNGAIKGLGFKYWASASSLASKAESESDSMYASSMTSIDSALPESLAGVVPGGSATYIPCEFSGYASCNEWFHVEDTHSWSEHVITDHLRNLLPSKCACWFCDDIIFDSEKSGLGHYANFMSRMEHIRDHFVQDGCTLHHIRIDCHFLDHIWQRGLITQKSYDAARNWTEGPFSGVSGIYAHDFEPTELQQKLEAAECIASDQRKEDHRRKKEGCDNLKLRSRNMQVKTFQSKTPRSASDRNHIQKSQQVEGSTSTRSNLRLSYSRHERGLFDSARPSCSKPGGPNFPHENSQALSTSARGLDNVSSRQDWEVELDMKLSQVTISNDRITRHVPEADQLEVVRDCGDKSGETSFTDNLRVPGAFASPKALVASPMTTSGHSSKAIRPTACNSIEVLRPKTQTSNEYTQARPTTSSDQSNTSGWSPSAESQITQSTSSSRRGTRPEKRKRRGQDPNEEGSDEDSVPARTNKGKEAEKSPLFACPYYKHDPLHYRDTRYCNGPGWPNIHRLKEHLYRKHRQAKHCRRCWTTFKEDYELTAHQQQDISCPRLKEKHIDGFGDSQERQLKSRKAFYNTVEDLVPAQGLYSSGGKQRGPRNVVMNEFDKWRKVYTILFPDDAEDEIPTPYYDTVEPHVSPSIYAAVRRQVWSEVRQELSAHLLPKLRQKLQKMREQDFDYNEHSLNDSLQVVLDEALSACSQDADEIHHPDEALEATAEEPLAHLIQQAEASALAPMLNMNMCQTENDYLYYPVFAPSSDVFTLESEVSITPRLGPSGPFLDHLGSGTDPQQATGAGKQSSDSGYGSIGYSSSQPWLWQNKQ